MSNDQNPKQDSMDKLVTESLKSEYDQVPIPGFQATVNAAMGGKKTSPLGSFWKWAPLTALVVTAVYAGCPQLIQMMNQRHEEVNQAQVFFMETTWQGPTDFLIDDLPTSERLNSVPQFGDSL